MHAIETRRNILISTQALAPRLERAKSTEDDDEGLGLCRLFCEMGEAYLPISQNNLHNPRPSSSSSVDFALSSRGARACVEIKFRTPHAIDATSSP